MNKGTLGNYLSDTQYNWLASHIALWHDNSTVVAIGRQTSQLLCIIRFDGTNYTCDQMGPTDTEPSKITVTQGIIGLYDGTQPNNFVYLYANTSNLTVDSYATLNLGVIPVVRTVVDTYDVVAVKDTNWLWTNLYAVLTLLQPDIKAIPSDATDRQNIAYEWDSQMSWRIFSPYMMSWVKGYITESNIAAFLKAQFGDKWNKLYDAMTTEYNPLHNYDMHEVEHTDDVKDENTSTTSSGTTSTETTDSGTSSGTDNTTETLNTNVAGNGSNDVSNKVYGFNNENASNASLQNGTTTNAQTTTGTNTNNNTTSQTSSSNGKSDSTVSSNGSADYVTDNNLDRELTRQGNIGVTTSQQLLEAELKLRQNIVLDTVHDDIIGLMTLGYYGGKY